MSERWTHERVRRGGARLGIAVEDLPTPEELYLDERESAKWMEERRRATPWPPSAPRDDAARRDVDARR